MRSFYTDHLGFTADLCKHVHLESARLTVRSPEGTILHSKWYDNYEDALSALRNMLPNCVNDLTNQPLT